MLGLGFGVAAVVTTAMFQIWQGAKQKDSNPDPNPLTLTLEQAGIAHAAAAVVATQRDERLPIGTPVAIGIRSDSAASGLSVASESSDAASPEGGRSPGGEHKAARLAWWEQHLALTLTLPLTLPLALTLTP